MKNQKINLNSIIRNILYIFEKGIYLIITLIILGLLIFQIRSVLQTRDNLLAQQAVRESLKTDFEKFRSKSPISESEKMLFGSILRTQIPPSENSFDYFPMIDYLNSATGLTFAIPTIESEGVNKGTTDLSAKGSLSQQGISQLLQVYQYDLVRFLTMHSAKITSSKEKAGMYDVVMQFKSYTAPTADIVDDNTPVDKIVQFGPDTLKAFNTYVQKANQELYVDPQEQVEVVDNDYESAESPF